MCWIEDMGYYEGREGSVERKQAPRRILTSETEFAGTLMGFDDYVSE